MTKLATVSAVSADGATVEFDGRTQIIPWPTLRKAAEQADTELADLYRAILRDAERLVCRQRPTRLQGTEVNTNVYGVIGIGVDGQWRPVRAYQGLRLRADEGIDLYRLDHAREEAAEIARRNGL
jgi:hypothetical protein